MIMGVTGRDVRALSPLTNDPCMNGRLFGCVGVWVCVCSTWGDVARVQHD